MFSLFIAILIIYLNADLYPFIAYKYLGSFTLVYDFFHGSQLAYFTIYLEFTSFKKSGIIADNYNLSPK